MLTKTCPKCKKELPAIKEWFNVCRASKNGFSSWCKKCIQFCMYCYRHKSQKERDQYLTKRRGQESRKERGLKLCIKCGKEKPATTEYFSKANNSKDGLYSYCKTCVRLRRNTKEQKLRRTIRTIESHGITFQEYLSIAENQGYKCAICGRKDKRLYVDHNHITGKIRGLLCRECNCALGYLKVDEKGTYNLHRAIKYLVQNNDSINE